MRRLPTPAPAVAMIAALSLAGLTLAGCHGKATSNLAQSVEASFDNRADQLDNLAERTTDANVAELARQQADAMHDEGQARKKAIEEAGTNATKADPRVLNQVTPTGATKP